MKKITMLPVMLLLSLLSMTAAAGVSLNIYVDNPDNVKISIDYREAEVRKGMNTFALDDYSNVNVDPRDYARHWINGVYVDGVNKITPGSSFYLSQYTLPDYKGKTLIIESCTKESLRTATLKLKIDNPKRISNLSLNGQLSAYVSMKDFPAGEFQEVKFSPDYNTTMQISMNGARPYKVVVDGTELEIGQYGVTVSELHEGMEVEVYGDYPDEEATVTFNWVNDGRGFMNEFYIYGSAEENYSHTPVDFSTGVAKVPLGKQVVIGHSISYKDYQINSYLVGEESNSYISESRQFYITGDVTITMDMSLTDEVKVKVNVDDPDAVLVKKDSYGKDLIEVSKGENEVTLHQSNSSLTFLGRPGYKVESVTRNGEAVSMSWDGKSFPVSNVSADDVFVVTTSKRPTFDCYVTFEKASDVIVRRIVNDSNFQPEELTVTDGRNKFELSEDYPKLFIYPAEGCWINSVNLNGDNVEANYSGYYEVAMAADYEAAVSSETINRDKSYVLWFETLTAPNLNTLQWRYNNGKTDDKDIAEGYQLKTFFHGDNYFELSNYYDYGKDATVAVYLNDEKLPFASEWSTNVKIEEMHDGDVIRVYLTTAEPASHKVSFAVTDSENPKVAGKVSFDNVVRDLIRPVGDLGEELTVLDGTRFDFAVANTADEKVEISVTANGESVMPDEEGIYHVTVSDDTAIGLVYEMVPYAELYFVGDFNGWALDTQMATEDGKAYSCEIPALDGQFKIVDADWDEIVLGSNGDKVVFGEPYEAAEDGHSNMMLAAGKSTDIRVSLDLPTHTLVLEGTAGIASVGADTDSPEAYYTLQGIRLSERPTAPGVYIRRSGNQSEKICVK